MSDLVIVGRVRKPQGIHGELLVEPKTDDPDTMFAVGRRFVVGTPAGDPDPAIPEATVRRARAFKDAYIIALEEVTDRNAAESWRGRHFLAPAEELAALADDEVYRHDLVGMRVYDARAGDIGLILHLYELPSGLMLEVSRGASTMLIPYRPEIVTSVDADARLVHIDAPDGLLE